MTKEETAYGTLYLCATPIGNLEDMTPRALRVLREADVIAAEDTRRSLLLLNHFGLKARLVRYDEHSRERQGAWLLGQLLDGRDVALVSDAGFPGIADPGEELVRQALAAGIKVTPVPGANAALCALVASGLPAATFFFGGFLPKTRRRRREQLALWSGLTATVVLYEAPHRIRETVADILGCWGERPVAVGREMTKVHEEFWRGSLSECLAWLEQGEPRGEFCLVIGGAAAREEKPMPDPLAEVRLLMEEGADKKAALAAVAKKHHLPRRELYNKLIAEEGNRE